MIEVRDWEVSDMKQPVKIQYKDDLLATPYVFTRMDPEWVDYLLGDINGIKIFKIKCFPREWVGRTHDLRYFMMHSS